MSHSSEITEVFKARNNILKQLEFQDFDTSDYSGSNINEVNSMFNSKQLDMLVEIPNTKKKTYVKFHLGKSLRLSNIQEYIEDLNKNIPPIPDIDFTKFPQAMPDMYKEQDVISAYRHYYFFEKERMHSWKGKIKGREIPNWIQDFHNMFN